MEVHHHPDLEHKKKRFKEYFLEFLMIFLAVTMGFIAENVREGISDRNKEREYIESMIQDLKTDTAQVNEKRVDLLVQMFQMDTLETLLRPDVNKRDSDVFECYHIRSSIMNQHQVGFSDRTITQLVSSGNMRLINKKTVSDRITEYYSRVKVVDAQRSYYVEYFHKCLAIFPDLYTFDSYHTKLDASGNAISPDFVFGKLRIVTTNPEALDRFKSTIEITKGIAGSYRAQIGDLKKLGDSLINFLDKEYDLTNK